MFIVSLSWTAAKKFFPCVSEKENYIEPICEKGIILLKQFGFGIFSEKVVITVKLEGSEWVPNPDLLQTLFLQDFQQVTEVSLTTAVTFVDVTRKPEPPRGQPRMGWKLPFDFFFPFKVALSRGVESQKGSVSPILILCLLLLRVLNLETK